MSCQICNNELREGCIGLEMDIKMSGYNVPPIYKQRNYEMMREIINYKEKGELTEEEEKKYIKLKRKYIKQKESDENNEDRTNYPIYKDPITDEYLKGKLLPVKEQEGFYHQPTVIIMICKECNERKENEKIRIELNKNMNIR